MDQHTFTLSPMSQDFELTPGQTYSGTVTISNPADATSDFNYKVTVDPFNVIGIDYTVDLLTEHNRSMMTKWITVPEPTGTLKPNESKKIPFTITVPENAPAGGQYAAIAVTSDNSTTNDGGLAVQNVLEIASVIYAKVDGETNHNVQILENNIPGFSITPPVMLTAMLKNDGNVHEYATYTITVSDFFTGQVILPTSENDGRYSEVIMPETTYLSQRQISNLPTVGVVKVSQTIRMGSEVSVQEGNIIICPAWFLFLIIATIIALIATVVALVRKYHRHKAAKQSA